MIVTWSSSGWWRRGQISGARGLEHRPWWWLFMKFTSFHRPPWHPASSAKATPNLNKCHFFSFVISLVRGSNRIPEPHKSTGGDRERYGWWTDRRVALGCYRRRPVLTAQTAGTPSLLLASLSLLFGDEFGSIWGFRSIWGPTRYGKGLRKNLLLSRHYMGKNAHKLLGN